MAACVAHLTPEGTTKTELHIPGPVVIHSAPVRVRQRLKGRLDTRKLDGIAALVWVTQPGQRSVCLCA